MTEYRGKLLDRMIRIYGFEHPIVVEFAKLCESYPATSAYDRSLTCLVESHEEFPMIEEDE